MTTARPRKKLVLRGSKASAPAGLKSAGSRTSRRSQAASATLLAVPPGEGWREDGGEAARSAATHPSAPPSTTGRGSSARLVVVVGRSGDYVRGGVVIDIASARWAGNARVAWRPRVLVVLVAAAQAGAVLVSHSRRRRNQVFVLAGVVAIVSVTIQIILVVIVVVSVDVSVAVIVSIAVSRRRTVSVLNSGRLLHLLLLVL
jgi:hypothetical protein